MDAKGNLEFSKTTLTELAQKMREANGDHPNKVARDVEALDLFGQMIGFGEPFAHAVKNRFKELEGEYRLAMDDSARATRQFQDEQRKAIAAERSRLDDSLSDMEQKVGEARQLRQEAEQIAESVKESQGGFNDPLAANIFALQRTMMREYRKNNVSVDEAAKLVSYTLWAYCGAFGAKVEPPDMDAIDEMVSKKTDEEERAEQTMKRFANARRL